MSKVNGFRAGLSRVMTFGVAAIMLAVGVVAFAYFIATAPQPAGDVPPDRGRLVRVVEAEKAGHLSAITAYGQTRASKRWTARAEVAGNAIEVHDYFEPGEFIKSGTVLAKIDPTDYKLSVDQFTAEVKSVDEQIRELDQQKSNLTEILRLRRRQVELAKSQYDRQHDLYKQNNAAKETVEQAATVYVTRLAEAEEVRNNLALIPIQRRLAEAKLDGTTAKLKKANDDLAECEIRLPFDGRCASKDVEKDQFVSAGATLGTFVNLDMIEVVAMVEVRKIHSLYPDGRGSMGAISFTDPDQIRRVWTQNPVTAFVKWELAGTKYTWKGRLARIESSLDTATRALPVVIEVENPNTRVIPGRQPPLLPGAFVEVMVFGAYLDDVYVIPRPAVREGRVHLVRKDAEDQGRLHTARVNVLMAEDELAVIDQGLEPGDQVILTDLFPASEGMLLRSEVVTGAVVPRPRDFVDALPANGDRN